MAGNIAAVRHESMDMGQGVWQQCGRWAVLQFGQWRLVINNNFPNYLNQVHVVDTTVAPTKWRGKTVSTQRQHGNRPHFKVELGRIGRRIGS